jgi:hypothetical protein
MKLVNAIQSLALSCMLGSRVGAAEMDYFSNISESSTSFPRHRRLQTEACTLLLKITTYEDGHEEQQVECYDEETKSYSKVESESSSENIQSDLLESSRKVNYIVIKVIFYKMELSFKTAPSFFQVQLQLNLDTRHILKVEDLPSRGKELI